MKFNVSCPPFCNYKEVPLTEGCVAPSNDRHKLVVEVATLEAEWKTGWTNELYKFKVYSKVFSSIKVFKFKFMGSKDN